MARLLGVVLALMLSGSLGQVAADVRGGAGAAPATTSAAGTAARPGDHDGPPGVLPPQPRIHVVVNRGSDRPGAPSSAAAGATPPAAAPAGRARNALPAGPSAGDAPADDAGNGRAPPYPAA